MVNFPLCVCVWVCVCFRRMDRQTHSWILTANLSENLRSISACTLYALFSCQISFIRFSRTRNILATPVSIRTAQCARKHICWSEKCERERKKIVRRQRKSRKNLINFHSMADQNESICAWDYLKYRSVAIEHSLRHPTQAWKFVNAILLFPSFLRCKGLRFSTLRAGVSACERNFTFHGCLLASQLSPVR